MKAIRILPVLFLMLCIGLKTNANDADSIANKMLLQFAKQDISEQIEYPKDARINMIEGVVAASFVLNDKGEIVINAINGHPLLINDVKKQLESMSLGYNGYNQKMIMRFKFEIL